MPHLGQYGASGPCRDASEHMDTDSTKTVTLRQVAERAGVSAATASLVMNDKGDISEATRRRVLKAVKEMNYSPRSSRQKADAQAGAQNTIRFLKIARHGQTVNRDHNHFIADYIDGMSYEATRRDYSLQVVSYESESIAEMLAALRGADPVGLVVLGTELSQAEVIALSQSGLPTVMIDTFHPLVAANFVDMDNDRLIYSALSHLKTAGFRRIGLVGSHSAVTNFALRESAFHHGMAALGLPVDPQLNLAVTSTLDGAYRDTLAQLAGRAQLAEAYLCANDIIAFGFIRAMREMGHRIPDDISVMGFDNLPMAEVFDPPLSSVNVPKQRIGAFAIRLLDDLIVARDTPPPVKILIDGELILRQSIRDREASATKRPVSLGA